MTGPPTPRCVAPPPGCPSFRRLASELDRKNEPRWCASQRPQRLAENRHPREVNHRALDDGDDRQCAREQVKAVVREPHCKPEGYQRVQPSESQWRESSPCSRVRGDGSSPRPPPIRTSGSITRAADKEESQDESLHVDADDFRQPLLDTCGWARHGKGVHHRTEGEEHGQCSDVRSLRQPADA